MSNKGWHELDPADRALRKVLPIGMEEGIKSVIVHRCGFEFFNTRPYHNYETWSDGYNVICRRDKKAMTLQEVGEAMTGRDRETYVWGVGEDLDEAIANLAKLLETGAEQKAHVQNEREGGGS
jgi:hypothetical protein